MNVRIEYEPIIRGRRHERRWRWVVLAMRGSHCLDAVAGYAHTRIGATIARDRAAARLRHTHGGAV